MLTVGEKRPGERNPCLNGEPPPTHIFPPSPADKMRARHPRHSHPSVVAAGRRAERMYQKHTVMRDSTSVLDHSCVPLTYSSELVWYTLQGRALATTTIWAFDGTNMTVVVLTP
jgi:hypothetical protein